ncbi:MAG: MliC family protein [Terricaulis silvestris]
MRSIMILAALALAACQPATQTASTTAAATTTPETIVTTTVDCTNAAPSGETHAVSCDGGKHFSVQYDAGSTCAIVAAGGQTYRIPAALAASGERYEGGGVEYWEHHGEAMLNGAAGGPYANCTLPEAN